MGNSFFKAFNQSLAEAQRVMGEKWTMGSTEYDAIAIDSLSSADRASLGGRFVDVLMTIHVSCAVVAQSGVKKGSVIVARGTKVRVDEVDNDGDGARTLICISPNVEAPR